MIFGAEVAVGADVAVAAGAEVAAGAAVAAIGVAAEPQADKAMLARISTASKAYSLRFTVSPPTENY